MGIGTSKPQNKLDVNGVVHAKEVKVDVLGWPDYVFEKDYSLPPIKDVEIFIKKNGHLPEVPTAEDAIKNGIELKAMNVLLLKKIEELTLYIIDQEKRIESLEKKINKKDIHP